jgi:hypothetical protein
MVDLAADSVRRIADARRTAESELKDALRAIAKKDDVAREPDNVAHYLPTFLAFASALFDAEAGELLVDCKDADAFQTALEGVAARVVEGVLPDLSLIRVTGRRSDESKRLSIQHDMDTDLLWEVGPDGTRKSARAEVVGAFAPHGDWENFAPKAVRFELRTSEKNYVTVKAALFQRLHQRSWFWAGRFHLRTTGVIQRDPPVDVDDQAAQSRLRRPGRPRSTPNLHPEVEPYLDRVSRKAPRRITIEDFCLVSGFSDDTIFGSWRRGDSRCTRAHAKSFEDTLKLTDERFLAKLTENRR